VFINPRLSGKNVLRYVAIDVNLRSARNAPSKDQLNIADYSSIRIEQA
jgi:hypothetical protein